MAIKQAEDFIAGMTMARDRFTHGLKCTPDDRLQWTPGGSAKSALDIAGRLAGFLGFISAGVATGALPEMAGRTPPPPPATRDAATAALEGAFGALIDAARGLSEADLAKSVPAPWGTPMTISQWLYLAQGVSGYFQGQLNYLQLCYGDEDPNMPPSWRPPGS